MSNRRRLARERLEIYLVHLILAYRRMIWIAALLLLLCASTITVTHPLVGGAVLLPTVYLILLCFSFQAVLYTARLGAWIGMLGTRDD